MFLTEICKLSTTEHAISQNTVIMYLSKVPSALELGVCVLLSPVVQFR